MEVVRQLPFRFSLEVPCFMPLDALFFLGGGLTTNNSGGAVGGNGSNAGRATNQLEIDNYKTACHPKFQVQVDE
jgi:hypothetical protein